MKIGDLVSLKTEHTWKTLEGKPAPEVGLLIDFDGIDPVVFWSEKFPDEVEYSTQLKVVSTDSLEAKNFLKEKNYESR